MNLGHLSCVINVQLASCRCSLLLQQDLYQRFRTIIFTLNDHFSLITRSASQMVYTVYCLGNLSKSATINLEWGASNGLKPNRVFRLFQNCIKNNVLNNLIVFGHSVTQKASQ